MKTQEMINNENATDMETVNKRHLGMGSLIEKIGEIIDEERAEININFPLSGGDDHHHIYRREREHEGVNTEQAAHSKRSSFWGDLGTEFPLSGGEYER